MAKKKEEKVETVGTAEAKAKFQEKLKESQQLSDVLI